MLFLSFDLRLWPLLLAHYTLPYFYTKQPAFSFYLRNWLG